MPSAPIFLKENCFLFLVAAEPRRLQRINFRYGEN